MEWGGGWLYPSAGPRSLDDLRIAVKLGDPYCAVNSEYFGKLQAFAGKARRESEGDRADLDTRPFARVYVLSPARGHLRPARARSGHRALEKKPLS